MPYQITTGYNEAVYAPPPFPPPQFLIPPFHTAQIPSVPLVDPPSNFNEYRGLSYIDTHPGIPSHGPHHPQLPNVVPYMPAAQNSSPNFFSGTLQGTRFHDGQHSMISSRSLSLDAIDRFQPPSFGFSSSGSTSSRSMSGQMSRRSSSSGSRQPAPYFVGRRKKRAPSKPKPSRDELERAAHDTNDDITKFGRRIPKSVAEVAWHQANKEFKLNITLPDTMLKLLVSSMGHYRSSIKERTIKEALLLYGIILDRATSEQIVYNVKLAKELVHDADQLTWTRDATDTSDLGWFNHPALRCMIEYFFEGDDAIGNMRPDLCNGSIPPAMVGCILLNQIQDLVISPPPVVLQGQDTEVLQDNPCVQLLKDMYSDLHRPQPSPMAAATSNESIPSTSNFDSLFSEPIPSTSNLGSSFTRDQFYPVISVSPPTSRCTGRASPDVLKGFIANEYKTLYHIALHTHPDKNLRNEEATTKFHSLSQAYSILPKHPDCSGPPPRHTHFHLFDACEDDLYEDDDYEECSDDDHSNEDVNMAFYVFFFEDLYRGNSRAFLHLNWKGSGLSMTLVMFITCLVSKCRVYGSDSISVAPPKGTTPPTTGQLLDDVHMAEEVSSKAVPPQVDGDDLVMTQSLVASPASLPNDSSTTVVDSAIDHSDVPLSKRARKFSDAHLASSHFHLKTTAAPPPVSTSSTVVDATPRTSTLSNAPYKYCLSILRMLKKQKDAFSFMVPVDPVLYNIPHHFQIIKHPMDLLTMEPKLLSSNPIKPDPNPVNPRYFNVAEFEADSSTLYLLSLLSSTPPPPPPPPPVIKKPARRASTSVPVIRRNDTKHLGRPKREIHPPPPKDLPYADAPKKHRGRGKKNNNEQLRFCGKLLDQLHRKQHQNIVGHFAQPVDPVALSIPDYPSIIKKPMDLSTMRNKLDANMYPTAEKFRDDFKLMINNCVKYNGTQSAVAEADFALQRLFDEKRQNLPPLHPEVSDEEEEEERTRTIAMIESQIETMRGPVASSSKAVKEPKALPPKKKGKKTLIVDDDVLTFEQKKDLSEAIAHLDGSKLERVIAIIHEDDPEIRDSQKEIELEIGLLPSAVLTKLYNFVLRPLRQPPTKQNRTGKGTGTGGWKRKSMDEDVEAEKIRQLEERMRLFEQQPNGHPAAAVAAANDSEHSSDSRSDDDSSGSDSE
ncbi:hypothetical protein EW146_g2409 [Bondarzewia mesenterica]|uniref:Bromo domain-containing protein n=1 Tax=Bondarzewia mesenterica TaxID=1095465 RepID=A0A4S4M0N9_9AGAM|nr:hypothetical protein EW146_g2409 [Bondarzewia mesenterica]